MIAIDFNPDTQVAKLAFTLPLTAGADVPVRVAFSPSPNVVTSIQIGLVSDEAAPATLAYTEDFHSENASVWEAVLDANDTRLIEALSGKTTLQVVIALVCTIDGARLVNTNLRLTVQPPVLSGPEGSEGGPRYYTAPQVDALLSETGGGGGGNSGITRLASVTAPDDLADLDMTAFALGDLVTFVGGGTVLWIFAVADLGTLPSYESNRAILPSVEDGTKFWRFQGLHVIGTGSLDLGSTAILLAGTMQAGYFVGDGSALTGLSAASMATGTLAPARGGSGNGANSGALSWSSATNLTGGGTLNLGGYTFTVPGTGTAVLQSGNAGALSITGGAGSMTLVAGTGNSRTITFQTTTSGGTATTALTLSATQTATFASTINSSVSGSTPGFNMPTGDTCILGYNGAQRLQFGGGGTELKVNGALLKVPNSSAGGLYFNDGQKITAPSGSVAELTLTPYTATKSSGTDNGINIPLTVNQSGSAGYTALLIAVTQTATGSGAKRLVSASVGGVEKFGVDETGTLTGDLLLGKTITAGGTTGAQTINKSTGSVNFAASATSLVVTNSLVTTSSVIQLTVATNDATMLSARVVAAAGSFTIYPNAAPTAETRVNFRLTN